ncbi:MAG: flagellar FliJ family protein [Phycisphaerales bacterium]
MARFVFSLEPVLKSRRRAEETFQRDVAGIERERMRLEEILRGHQRSLVSNKDVLRAGLTGLIEVRDLRLHANSSLQVMHRAQQIVLELAGVYKRLEAARTRLIEASRRRRAIEFVRDRRYEQWKAALNKAETAALDELAVIAAARKESDL